MSARRRQTKRPTPTPAPPPPAPAKEPLQIALELRGLAGLLGGIMERDRAVVFMDPNVIFLVTCILTDAAAELER